MVKYPKNDMHKILSKSLEIPQIQTPKFFLDTAPTLTLCLIRPVTFMGMREILWT